MTNVEYREFKKVRFARWYLSIPNGDLTCKRTKLLSDLHITGQTLRNYIKGKTEIPTIAIPFINQIAGEDIFSL